MQIHTLHHHVKVDFIQNVLNGSAMNSTLRAYYIELNFIEFNETFSELQEMYGLAFLLYYVVFHKQNFCILLLCK